MNAGFPFLMDLARHTNPRAYPRLADKYSAARNVQAALAFKDTPIVPEQQHLLASGETAPSAGGGQSAGGGRKGSAQRALDCLANAGAEFFHSPNGRAWVDLAGVIHKLDSEPGFRAVVSWLTRHLDVSITGNAKNELKDLLLNRAYAGPVREVQYRQATIADPHNPAACINLMDSDGNGVCVDKSGWRVEPVSNFPVRMTNRHGAKPLPKPVRAGDGLDLFERLDRHLPLKVINNAADPNDPGVQQRAAMLLYILNQFFRAGSAVHLFLNAPQGSGKTMAMRRLKSLTDDDTAGVLSSVSRNEGDLFAFAEQQTSLGLDNISRMDGTMADIFCGFATGTGQQKRGLYTDDDRRVYAVKASLMYNSVRADIIQRPDLRDRTLDVDLPPLDPKRRKPDQELDAEWEQDRPYIFADHLDALTGALSRLAAVRASTAPEALPRFADAALLAEAAAQALGWKPGLCLDAIRAARQGASSRHLEENPYAVRVRAMLEAEGGEWTGPVSALRDKLYFMSGPEWGRGNDTLNAFTSMVYRLDGPLRDTWGIETIRNHPQHGGRTMTLRRKKP